ncbi:hypothetical protein ARMSODRAFT_1086126 [Armillaria solidipes]|uniref:Uncharacterized protein n=1 Tax=Armillaria solidipes TaxID=1076256 RepID=A0A2H3B9S1_9AGAR|nr:hypothetical protein ARMSODRAFT_1086126 [Armillaria solidipes]
MFQFLDTQLNCGMLYALLHGIYTGILAVTLLNIFINKLWPIRRALVVVIILLYVLITISFAVGWSSMHSAFIGNGQSFRTVYLKLNGMRAFYLETGITASASASLTDLYMIWCCWVVWGRRWLIILLPIFFLASAMVSKIMAVYHEYVNESADVFPVLYASFILATTLWCTLLIIHRILTVTRIRRGAEGRLGVFHRFVEALVESSALYSVSLILFLAFAIRDDLRMHYFDIVAGIVKGIAPTLLVGRITAGHRARPDDSWQGSVMASASIRSRSQEHSQTSFREASPMLDGDLEAQREISVREPSPILRSVSAVADYAHPNTDVSPETSPHLGNHSLLHDRSSLYEDAILGYTAVDEATVDEDVALKRIKISDSAL